MKILVDEIPLYSCDCLFCDMGWVNKCKLDETMCDLEQKIPCSKLVKIETDT